jgi:tetratricopeptide (TPR) repeat protein
MKNPPEIEAMLALFDNERFEEALAKVDAFLVTRSDVAMAWRFKGECLANLKRYEEAIAPYAKAAEMGGRVAVEAKLSKATAEWNAGKHDDARATLTAVLDEGEAHEESVLARASQMLGLMSMTPAK